MDSRVELFRRLALQLPEAVESSHMGSPDFRLNDRIFATLSAQATGQGVLKLSFHLYITSGVLYSAKFSASRLLQAYHAF